MAIQSAVGTSLRYILETVYGVTPVAPASIQEWERSGGSLSLQKETYTTANIRSDRQTAYMRHGVRSAAGQLAADLATGAHTDFFELTFMNDWVDGVTASGSYTVASGEVTATAGTFNVLDVGDVVEYTAGAQTIIARVSNKALNGSSVMLIPLDEADDIADVSSGTVGLEVLGATLKNGKLGKSATFETYYPEIAGDKYKRATGVMVGSAEIALPPTGLATVSYTMDGRNSTKSSTAISSTVTPPVLGSLLAAVNGAALVNGVPMALITDLSLSVDNALSGRPVVGSNFRAQIFPGKLGITGNLTVYLENLDFEGYFDDEEEISIVVYLAGDTEGSFLQITIPRVKLSSSEVTADGEDGATIQCAFTALLDSASNCMIKIQEFTGA
jgi:hypothetical protein